MTSAPVPPSNLSPDVIAERLPELVLREVLRAHLASAPAIDHGWLAALHDPVLAPALALRHRRPERRWTVAQLANAVAEEAFSRAFKREQGSSPTHGREQQDTAG